MLLSLKNDHKKHLTLLTEHSAQVIVDFCKIAIDFLYNGISNKIINTAANKLNVDQDNILNCIYGLVNLLLIASKHKLSEADFKDSIVTIGFNSNQQTVLYEFYKSKYTEVLEILKKLSIKEPHYVDLDWRFEVQVSSRSLLHQVQPLITMDLSLNKSFGDDSKPEHILMQTDPMNLVHVTEELEKALLESRSRYSRRIQNTFVQ